MNFELIIIFLISIIVIEMVEYEKSKIHALVTGISLMLINLDLGNILTITGTSLDYAKTLIGLATVMTFYKVIILSTAKNDVAQKPKQMYLIDPAEFE